MKSNAYHHLLFFSLFWGIYCNITAQPGCMEKSLQLASPFDPKEYHYVKGGDGGACSCPCNRYRAQSKPLPYGQCPRCKHFYASPSLIVVTKKISRAALQKKDAIVSPVAYESSEQIIKTWRSKQK